jgi:GNAT superfamily N-acetyltransferase
MIQPRLTASPLERELACDLRRTVLCGELNWERDAVSDALDGDEATDIALAFAGEKPVATARLTRGPGGSFLELLAVLPAHRGRGLGSALVEFLAARARGLGAEELGVLAPRQLGPFFQARGFDLGHESGEIQYLKRDLVRHPPQRA